MARLRLVGTGGTIQNTLDGRLSPDAVLQRALRAYDEGGYSPVPIVETTEVLRAGSETFVPSSWLEVRAAVLEALEDKDIEGVVVSHGTFTAEETAYFLHLTVPTERPVVVVCSQRKYGTIGNDGDRNLCDALRVASAPDARGKGVLLVMNEEIHCARDVLKSNQRPGGFVSGATGILGSIERDQVTFYRAPLRRHTTNAEFSSLDQGASLPRVDVVATYTGADGAAARALAKAGSAGLVVIGFAFNGFPHELQRDALEEVTQSGGAVVLVSRGGAGRVPRGDPPFVYGDNLSPQKARVLLSVALTFTRDTDELQRIFDQY